MAVRAGAGAVTRARPGLIGAMRELRPPERRVGVRGVRAYGGALYLTPSFILLVTFVVIPIVMSLYFSFTNYSVLDEGEWVGGANYERLIADPEFHAALEAALRELTERFAATPSRDTEFMNVLATATPR